MKEELSLCQRPYHRDACSLEQPPGQLTVLSISMQPEPGRRPILAAPRWPNTQTLRRSQGRLRWISRQGARTVTKYHQHRAGGAPGAAGWEAVRRTAQAFLAADATWPRPGTVKSVSNSYRLLHATLHLDAPLPAGLADLVLSSGAPTLLDRLAKRPDVPLDILPRLACHDLASVREAAIKNPNCPIEVLTARCAVEQSSWVLSHLAASQRLSPSGFDVLWARHLARDHAALTGTVLLSLGDNPQLPDDVALRFSQRLLKEFDREHDDAITRCWHHHPHLADDFATQLYREPKLRQEPLAMTLLAQTHGQLSEPASDAVLAMALIEPLHRFAALQRVTPALLDGSLSDHIYAVSDTWLRPDQRAALAAAVMACDLDDCSREEYFKTRFDPASEEAVTDARRRARESSDPGELRELLAFSDDTVIHFVIDNTSTPTEVAVRAMESLAIGAKKRAAELRLWDLDYLEAVGLELPGYVAKMGPSVRAKVAIRLIEHYATNPDAQPNHASGTELAHLLAELLSPDDWRRLSVTAAALVADSPTLKSVLHHDLSELSAASLCIFMKLAEDFSGTIGDLVTTADLLDQYPPVRSMTSPAQH